MPIFSRKRSELQKRLRRLDKELSAVDSNLKTLSRHVDQRGDDLANGRASVAPQRRRAPKTPAPVEEKPSPRTTDDVFGRVDNSSTMVSAGYDLETPEDGLEGPEPGSTAHRRDGDERFASYFMSGGLKTTGPLRGERHMQRNKALFLLAFVVIVALILWRILSQ
jgi:hypothetical protein